MGDAVRDQLRRAAPADAPGIARLVRECYEGYVERIGREPKPMTADYGAAVRDHEVWVLEEDGDLRAVLELIPADDHVLVENVAVSPRLQRHGIGKCLMAFAEKEAQARGVPEMRLYTNAAFIENIVLYESIGYRETGREGSGGARRVNMTKRL